jgi:hypothetical protein
MNLPDDDNQWSKHSAVTLTPDRDDDNQWSSKDYIKMCFVFCTQQNIQVLE